MKTKTQTEAKLKPSFNVRKSQLVLDDEVINLKQQLRHIDDALDSLESLWGLAEQIGSEDELGASLAATLDSKKGIFDYRRQLMAHWSYVDAQRAKLMNAERIAANPDGLAEC